MAAERRRTKVRRKRADWFRHRIPAVSAQPERVVFIDETSVKTNLTRLRGWAPRGDRLVMDAPFGSWGTQTFIAGLTADAMIAPWVIKGAMDGPAFAAYVEKVLVPELAPGTVVILDNLATHKNSAAAKAMRDAGCWFVCRGKPSTGRFPVPSNSCRLTALISTPSKWHSRSSKLTSEESARVPSPTCSTPSPRSAISTRLKSAGITSRLQDMSQVNGGAL